MNLFLGGGRWLCYLRLLGGFRLVLKVERDSSIAEQVISYEHLHHLVGQNTDGYLYCINH